MSAVLNCIDRLQHNRSTEIAKEAWRNKLEAMNKSSLYTVINRAGTEPRNIYQKPRKCHNFVQRG